MACQSGGLAIDLADLPAPRLGLKILALVREGQRKTAAAWLLAHRLLLLGLLLLNLEPSRTPAVHPGYRQLFRRSLTGHLGPDHAPATRHYAIEIVAAA